MTASEISGLALSELGGLALFIFGLSVMTEGLRAAAGMRLRSILKRSTKGRMAGLALGAVLGALVQSSVTTVMLIGFIHAGLITLAAAIPPIIGANIGTTLSMQLISFRIGHYWFAPVIIGVILLLMRPQWHVGRALIGFGLLFLGMNMMSAAIVPYREALAPWLMRVDGATLQGMLTGLGVSVMITALLQSSGATIGICFALISAGAFTALEQVFPLILGAHIGTCATALLAGIGTNIEGRRGAVAHLAFNIIGALLAIAAAPFLLRLMELTSPDLIRQAANLHTATMALAAVVLLPLSNVFARGIRRIIVSREPAPEQSYLDEALLDRPEQAIVACIRELQRVARICDRSFRLNAEIIFKMDRRKVAAIRRNEDTIDEIQRSMREFLAAMTNRYLSRRQAILIQHLSRCMTDIERIEDHNQNLCDLSINRRRSRKVRFTRQTLEMLLELFEAADRVLQLVIQSLNPDNHEFQSTARSILEARDAYVEKSLATKAVFTEKIASHEFPPLVGIYLIEYTTAFDRIVRHAKMIALAESHPYFWIKREKLSRVAAEAEYPLPPPENMDDFLDKLQSEGYG